MRLRGLMLVGLVLLGACGDDGEAAAPVTDQGTITVFAAASLSDAFTEVGAAFEAEHEGVTVAFNFASSSALRQQIVGGAPADVFASANSSQMEQVFQAGEATTSAPFARNRLAIAVPPGNPAGVTGLADFADGDLLLGLCAEQVPCGQFGREALAGAGVEPSIDTNAPDVRALLAQVESGDLDAGIVYRTDVLAAGDAVDSVDIPADQDVAATYPICVLTNAGEPGLAQAFVDFVLADDGQAILATHGFDPVS
jgi:molybdate transport system substrate-binding protein